MAANESAAAPPGANLKAVAAVRAFFDPKTSTISYVVHDEVSRRAAIIDPVLDYNLSAGRTGTTAADLVLAHVAELGLQVDWILETHAHADHLSAAFHLRETLGGRIATGEHIREVQATFKRFFNLEPGFAADGSAFDHLFRDGETFRIGALEVKAMLVPGHTPADMAYLLDDCVFVGDTLFMPDVGTARADFPGGDARTLYRSLRRLLELPAETTLYMCHDYPPNPRPPQWQTTVAAQRRENIHVRDGISEDAFVAMRTARDATLGVPALLMPAMQVNVRAGRMPPSDANGVAYLRTPLNALPIRK